MWIEMLYLATASQKGLDILRQLIAHAVMHGLTGDKILALNRTICTAITRTHRNSSRKQETRVYMALYTVFRGSLTSIKLGFFVLNNLVY
jgi:hypothetical protein